MSAKESRLRQQAAAQNSSNTSHFSDLAAQYQSLFAFFLLSLAYSAKGVDVSRRWSTMVTMTNNKETTVGAAEMETTLFALRHAVDSDNTIRTEGYVYAASERKAGNYFKRNGFCLYINGSSCIRRYWVQEMTSEEIDDVSKHLPRTFGKGHSGEITSPSEWFATA